MDYEVFLKHMKESALHFEQVARFEKDKFDIIVSSDLAALEKAISKEQALVMKSTALEKKRLALMGEERNRTFSEVIENAPGSFRALLESEFEKIKTAIFDTKRLNDQITELVKSRLERMDGLIPKGYDKTGNKTSGGYGDFSTTI